MSPSEVRTYRKVDRQTEQKFAARETLFSGLPTRSDTNRAVQPQKMTRGLAMDLESTVQSLQQK